MVGFKSRVAGEVGGAVCYGVCAYVVVVKLFVFVCGGETRGNGLPSFS